MLRQFSAQCYVFLLLRSVAASFSPLLYMKILTFPHRSLAAPWLMFRSVS